MYMQPKCVLKHIKNKSRITQREEKKFSLKNKIIASKPNIRYLFIYNYCKNYFLYVFGDFTTKSSIY